MIRITRVWKALLVHPLEESISFELRMVGEMVRTMRLLPKRNFLTHVYFMQKQIH
jgi:hypothetical protein